jgi:hypothetical protein
MQTPRWIWITLVSLAGCGWHLNGQTLIDLTNQARLESNTILPAQCAVGQVFFKSNAPAGANLYTCIAPNSWTAVGLSQGAAASRPANCTFGQIWLSTDTGAITYCSVTGNPGTWSPALAGSGSVVLTSSSGAPSANCTAASSSNLALYLDTANQEEWWCPATNTWKKILSVTGSGPYEIVGGTGTAPARPASGSVACYFDSTTNTQVCLDSGTGTSTMVRVWSGTASLGTGAIPSAACATAVTVSATGVAATDVVTAGFNGDPTAVTGYIPLITGMLTIIAYPATDSVNFKVCNNSSSSITPGPITLNWRVTR